MTSRKSRPKAEAHKWPTEQGIDVALDAIRRIAKASGMDGVVLHVRVDGRVEIEVRDAGRRYLSRTEHADLHQDGSPLPLPSEALMIAVDSVQARREALDEK